MNATPIIEGYEGPRRIEEVALRGATDRARALGRFDRAAPFKRSGGPVVLTVSSGPGRFQVSVWDQGENRGHVTPDPAASTAAGARLVLCGQSAVLPVSETLGREVELAAILAFAEDGGRAERAAREAVG